jgi:hypothetical protein
MEVTSFSETSVEFQLLLSTAAKTSDLTHKKKTTKLRGLSQRANYTDWETVACRWS